jgi:hypothetical protein
MSGPMGSQLCSNFVEALGLKTLFSAFMGKVNSWMFYALEPTYTRLVLLGLEEAKNHGTSFRRHFSHSGHHLVLTLKPFFRLDGPNTPAREIRRE